MAPTRRSIRVKESQAAPELPNPWVRKLTALLITVTGPALLIYLNLRCEKNQCVLYQLPLVIPTHFGAYFSSTATGLFIGFMALMFFFKVSTIHGSKKGLETTSLSPGFSALLSSTLLLLGIAYLKPEYIHIVRAEYLRLLICTTVFTLVFSTVITLTAWLNLGGSGKMDKALTCAFFLGTKREWELGPVELKYFFYVHIGLIGLALLDLILLLDFALKYTLTAPLAFLALTQYLVVAHTLMYENFLEKKPFVENENLGFYWLMKVMMYLPFLYSLPVHYAAVTEIVLPQPAMLADCVLFLFGFIVYASSIHQKENFVRDPSAYKSLKSIPTGTGQRLLTSSYWGIVQKPDYLGYMIIWLSWIIACGMSGLSLVVLSIVYTSIFLWAYQVGQHNKDKFGSGWTRYTNLVPNKLIPYVF